MGAKAKLENLWQKKTDGKGHIPFRVFSMSSENYILWLKYGDQRIHRLI
jgi:hypothetical protein